MTETETEQPTEDEPTTGDDEPTTGDDDDEAEAEEGHAAELEPEPEQVEHFDPQAFERAIATHRRKLEKVFGPAWEDMAACGVCGGQGYTPRVVVAGLSRLLESNGIESAAELAALAELPPMKHDPNAVPCPDCNGWGMRQTGSLREGNAQITCEGCAGSGWRDRRQLQALEAMQTPAAPAPFAGVPPQPVWNQMLGRWETPNGQPIEAQLQYAPEQPAPTG